MTINAHIALRRDVTDTAVSAWHVMEASRWRSWAWKVMACHVHDSFQSVFCVLIYSSFNFIIYCCLLFIVRIIGRDKRPKRALCPTRLSTAPQSGIRRRAESASARLASLRPGWLETGRRSPGGGDPVGPTGDYSELETRNCLLIIDHKIWLLCGRNAWILINVSLLNSPA